MNRIAMKRTLLYIIAMTLLAAAGCSRISRNPDLLRADALTATDPRAALRLLDSLPSADLSETDRHFHDLLSVKAADKAYIAHTSDSLILDAAAWFKGTDLHPEALYYAGRVYSDLGDYPTALRYFQNALDSLPENTQQADLRNCVLSQTGRLLVHINLQQQALPYLKKSLQLTLKRKDKANLPYDYQVLGTAYIDLKQYDTAYHYFSEAMRAVKGMPDSDQAFMQGFLAIAEYHEDKINSALNHIRDIILRVQPMDRDFFKAYATEIYYKAGIYDTVRLYASDIIQSRNDSYKITGYQHLLKEEVRIYIPTDSINEYFNRYLAALDSNHRRHDTDAAILQNSFYNYSIHEREKMNLTAARARLMTWLLIAVISIVILTIINLYYRHSIIRKKTRLNDAFHTIKQLNERIRQMEFEQVNQQNQADNSQQQENALLSKISEARALSIVPDEIPSTLRTDMSDNPKDIQTLYDSEIAQLRIRAKNLNIALDVTRKTEIYMLLRDRVEQNKVLKDKDPLWNTIFESVNNLSPDFRTTLERLSGQKLSDREFRYAVLIRVGLSSLQIGTLYCKTKSTINYHRKQLCKKLFGDKIPSDELSKVLRLI